MKLHLVALYQFQSLLFRTHVLIYGFVLFTEQHSNSKF